MNELEKFCEKWLGVADASQCAVELVSAMYAALRTIVETGGQMMVQIQSMDFTNIAGNSEETLKEVDKLRRDGWTVEPGDLQPIKPAELVPGRYGAGYLVTKEQIDKLRVAMTVGVSDEMYEAIKGFVNEIESQSIAPGRFVPEDLMQDLIKAHKNYNQEALAHEVEYFLEELEEIENGRLS